MEQATAIIVAGGKGTRMGLEIKKQYVLLEGKEVLAHTIEKFEQVEEIEEIIVVVSREEIEFVEQEICKKYGFNKVHKVVAGGKERQDSVYEGLKQAGNAKYVLIHDGARPFVKGSMIKKIVEEVKEKKACVVGVRVKDTIKECQDQTQKVTSTLKREKLWSVQTPQAFEKELLQKAYQFAKEKNIVGTDDSSLVEKMGQEVFMVQGDYLNLKITTKEDLLFAKEILKMQKK